MTDYIVTRHAGALEWLQRRLGVSDVQTLGHLEGTQFHPGDRVCGVLPLAWAARICAQGAQAHVISVDVPPELRGQELSMNQLESLGARLVQYDVKVVEIY